MYKEMSDSDRLKTLSSIMASPSVMRVVLPSKLALSAFALTDALEKNQSGIGRNNSEFS